VLKRFSPNKKINEAATSVAKPVKNQRAPLLDFFGEAIVTVPGKPSTIGIAVVVALTTVDSARGFGRDIIGMPAIERSTSLRITAAVWYLFEGDFASAPKVIESKLVGIEESKLEGDFGGSFTCWYAIATGESPLNGVTPVKSSYRTHPLE
jgi:hypothetical protein